MVDHFWNIYYKFGLFLKDFQNWVKFEKKKKKRIVKFGLFELIFPV